MTAYLVQSFIRFYVYTLLQDFSVKFDEIRSTDLLFYCNIIKVCLLEDVSQCVRLVPKDFGTSI